MSAVLITSSILILAIAALRPLLRGRIDPRVQYALWLVAALRLLLPVNLFTSAYSALALLEKAERPVQAVQAIGQASLPVPAMSYEDAYVLALQEYQQNAAVTTSFTDLDQVEARARELAQRRPTLGEVAAKYARPVWLGGAALMAGWFLLVNLGLRRRLKSARRLNGVECPLPVYVSDALPSPCLCGALRPRIYVTPAALETPDRLRHVLAHELAHHRHRDHWWALLRCACLCLYWFDPLVWWAAALSRQDCELACDAGAIRTLGEGERIPYGRTLVGMIAAGRTSLLQTATTMTGGRRRVRERVRLIARRPKTVLALALAAALLLALAVGCAFSGAPEESPEPEAKTLDNLQQRLEDIPEELRDRVRFDLTDEEPGHLADYWFDVPAEWTEDFRPWLLSVLTFSQEELDQTAGSFALNHAPEPFAKSGSQYYALHWSVAIEYAPNDKEQFNAAFEAIKAFAEKTVLETEGVEPYNSSQPLDTLQARLMDMPEDLQADAAALRGDEPTVVGPYGPSALTQYWMNRPYTDYQEGWGWLLTVYQWDQAQFEENYSDVPGTWHCFAKDDTFYYVTAQATDVRVPASEEMVAQIPGATEVETRYVEVFEAIRAFAEKTVLETQGVEPYTPGQPVDAQQSRLADLPEEWRDKVSVSHALGGEVGCLASYVLSDPKWADLQGGWLLDLYRMDEAGIQGKLNQGLWPAVDIFARSGGQYYALTWPGDGRYQNNNEFWDAVNAIKHYVTDTVLATEGVEPFDPFTTPPHFFSAVPSPPLEPGSCAIDGLDYTLVTSYAQVPEDPEQWYLVGQLPGNPVWMFTRGYGQETMFQVEDQLTQVFPYTACFFGGGQTHDGHAPQLMQLPGFGWGPKGTFGPFAVITHIFQGGTDQMYQLTVYDLGIDAVTPYVHDWEALMNDFNQTAVVQFDPIERTAYLSYGSHRAELKFDETQWDVIQQNHGHPQVYDTDFSYSFNHDGTANLDMSIWTDPSFSPSYTARWTILFTGDGFETTGFSFVQSVYP